MTYTATYSPDDNKLRLYASSRLDKETYDRVKAAGFKWAPKQDLFVAPMWTPEREDLLLELAGEIDDEDKSLVERAEERAGRFEDYSDSRQDDANRAHAAVKAIADNIPFGQPILVGHHSERRARKDAEKIDNGMRRAVKMWEQSKYWEQRAKGAIQHAKYKERPDVRARRIKTLEADLRRCIAAYTPRDNHIIMQQKGWNHPPDAPKVPHVFCGGGSRGGSWVAVEDLERIKAGYARWEQHYRNRITYERAMLDDGGGLVAEQQEIKVGGRVLVRGEWVTVLRINRKDGKALSFRTNRRYVAIVSAEEIKGYQPPTEEHAAEVAAAMKRPSTCNYPGERFATCTHAEWKAIHKDYKSTVHVIEATDTVARHCVRYAIGYKLHLPEPTAEEQAKNYSSSNRTHTYWPVFITDAKRIDPPSREEQDTKPRAEVIPAPERAQNTAPTSHPDNTAYPEGLERAREFEAMRETLKAGVKVVSAPQLFPTPADLARRMCDEAGNLAGLRVLEPSAGTGNLIRAAMNNATGFDNFRLVAVELSHSLVEQLKAQRQKTLYANAYNFTIICSDFLECNGDLGKFDRVLMNPPFVNGEDIKHIKHAIKFLKPGGRLVAICANGPRQQEELKPLAVNSGGTWEPLPADTFKQSGTAVNTALLVYHAPEDDAAEA